MPFVVTRARLNSQFARQAEDLAAKNGKQIMRGHMRYVHRTSSSQDQTSREQRKRRYPPKPDGRSPFAWLARVFENWVDPLKAPASLQPPDTIWRYIWHYARQARLPLFAVFALDAVNGWLEALFLFYVGRVIDILTNGTAGDGWQGLYAGHGAELVAIFVFAVVVRFVIAVAKGLLDNQTIGRGFYSLVSWQAYSQVARQSVGFFTNQHSGSILTKAGQAGDSVGNFITGSLSSIWTILSFLGTSLFLFAQLNLGLAGIVVVWVGAVLLIARYFLPRLREASTDAAEAHAEMNGRFVDVFSNIQTIRLYGSAHESDGYMREGFRGYLDAIRHSGRLSVGIQSAMTLMSGLAFAATVALCIDLWTRDAITVGSVAFALALILRLNMWMGWLVGSVSGLMRNFGVLQNTMELVARPIDVVDAPGAVAWQPARGAVAFKNVTFGYLADKPVLKGLDLDIAPGEKVGLVGHSGVGKTTIVSLLLRFYDLQKGAILIDGQDIAEMKQDSLRAGIGMVTQEPALLHRSVRDNILYGKPGASDAEVIAAAKKARAHDFILELKDPEGRTGYDAHVGERGIKLSGGQRQRIAIARVILKNAPILVLDEATSALDSEIEAEIQSQLALLMKGKTVVAIAHRLSTIAAMDRLIVMDDGRIVEQGTHADLLKKGGIYAGLWARQSGGFIDADETEPASRSSRSKGRGEEEFASQQNR